MSFHPRSATFRGAVPVRAPIDEAFPLFSPDGERRWVPGWDFEPLHPAGVLWAEGQIFRTQEESGEAIWVVSTLDRERHRAVYHRVEPGRYVARVDVDCRATGADRSEARISYSFTGLSESGNDAIAAMSAGDFEAKMARWASWIDAALSRR